MSTTIPYAPRERFTQPNRISDLLLRAAEGQADAQMRSGQIWGNALGNVGKIASNAVLDYGEAKAQKAEAEALSRRDQAFMGLLDSSGGNPDPKEILRIFGPREGLKVAEGIQAFQSLGQKKGEQALADLPKLIGGMNAVGEGMRAALYPSAAAAIKQTGLFPEGAIPDQYDPNFWKEASAFVEGMTPQKPQEGFTLGEGQVRFGPDGKQIAAGPVQAPKPAQPRVVGRSLVDDGGKVIYRDPEAPNDERLVQVMDDSGKPVWARESQAVGMPATQAPRAVTGAERQALAYYNRAKQAVDDIASLEDKMQKQGFLDQARLKSGMSLLQSPEQQRYNQAQRAFTEARLRKESGAAIPAEEYANDARTYFQQPGDSESVKEQKRAARAVVLNGLAYGSGKAYDEYYGEPLQTPAKGGQKRETSAPAKPPRMVKYQGRLVPFASLSPDLQRIVVEKGGGQ